MLWEQVKTFIKGVVKHSEEQMAKYIREIWLRMTKMEEVLEKKTHIGLELRPKIPKPSASKKAPFQVCFFASRTPTYLWRVFSCLSEAKKIKFDHKAAIFGHFFH